MSRLRLGFELKSFDLERVGFSLFVLGSGGREGSGGYLQMTLDELARFIAALKAAEAEIELVVLEPEPAEPAKEADEPVTEIGTRRSAAVIRLPRFSLRGRPSVPDVVAQAEPAGRAEEPSHSSEPPDDKPRRIRITRPESR